MSEIERVSRKRVMGKGLDALLGSGSLLDEVDRGHGEKISLIAARQGEAVKSIAVERIKTNPNQPRKVFDDEALGELAQSVRQQGIIQPVIAEMLPDGNYQLVAGERRWRASQMAGLKEIPVLVREFSDEEKIGISLVENIQREDLSAVEEARAYQFAIERLGFSQQKLADRVGRKRSTVTNSLRLLKLPLDMQAAIEKEEMTAGHARALLSVENQSEMRILFEQIVEQGLSVRESEKRALAFNRDDGRQEELTKSNLDKHQHLSKDAEFEALQEEFINFLGTKVSLRGSMEKGRMEVSWFNKEDLYRIYDKLSPAGNGGQGAD